MYNVAGLLKYRFDNDFNARKGVGYEIRAAQPNEVLIDLDSADDMYVLLAMLPLFAEHGFPLTIVTTERSRHGNRHVYLMAPRNLTEVERVALQAILGSDRKREALGFLRAVHGVNPVSVFFRKPDAIPEAL